MDVVSFLDLEVGSFMEGSRSGHSKGESSTTFEEEKFYFWKKSVDKIAFIYDHLNAIKDVGK